MVFYMLQRFVILPLILLVNLGTLQSHLHKCLILATPSILQANNK